MRDSCLSDFITQNRLIKKKKKFLENVNLLVILSPKTREENPLIIDFTLQRLLSEALLGFLALGYLNTSAVSITFG